MYREHERADSMSASNQSKWASGSQGGLVVSLDGVESAGLILKMPSNVWFENQSGGHYCLRQRAEGVYLPLAGIPRLEEKPVRTLDYDLSEVMADQTAGSVVHGMSDIEVRDCERVLVAHGCKNVSVDRSRLRESWEAWVFVVVQPAKSEFGELRIKGLESPIEAVLVWGNSD